MTKLHQKRIKKTVVVLGPPRSGTSTVAGLLHILGVDMGRLRPPNPDNPKGFFEDKDFLFLMDDIFEAANPGSSGFKPPNLSSIQNQKEKFENRIKKLVQARCLKTNSYLWGWKVVGTNLAIELFLPYLINPHFIVVYRNILDTAQSCVRYTKTRERLKLEEAVELSLFYYRSILDFFRKNTHLPKYFISYEAIIRNPKKETKNLATFLEIEPTKIQLKKAKNFVIPEKIRWKERKKAVIKEYLLTRIPRFAKKCLKNPLKIPFYILKSFHSKIKERNS